MHVSAPLTNGMGKGPLKALFGGIAVVAFLVLVFLLARSGGTALPQGMVLYWGEGCPHCAIVETYVKENNVESKVSFTRKEVFLNRANAREMALAAKQCGVDPQGMGVPFLWTGTACLTGDKDIIAYFQRAIGTPAFGASASSL